MQTEAIAELSAKPGRAESFGRFLFKYRSALPFVVAILMPVAMVGFKYPYGNPDLDLPWELVCLTVSLLGFGIRVLTAGFVPKGTSGRNTSEQRAYSLNTTGMYSLCRNPLYLGNFLMWLGVTMFPRIWWALAVVVVLFAVFYIFIIHAESQFLRRQFREEYTGWASKTPAFFPRLWGWRRPALPFSFRTVLRREHTSFFSLIVGFVVMEICGDFVIYRRLECDPFWIITLAVSTVLYVVLRTLKKSTTVLDVEGR